MKEYAGNVIAEHVLYVAHRDGHYTQLIKGIFDHKRSGDAVTKANKYVISRSR